jgi:hypothetical protein
MATFYSIVYANTRPSVGERVSIALIVRDERRLLFHYAPRKLTVLARLLSAETMSLLQTCLTNLNSYIANPELVDELHDSRFSRGSSDISVSADRFLEQDYVSYLARYNNNLLTFSQPVPIDIPVTEVIYQSLFTKYVFADWEPVAHDPNHIRQVVKIAIQTEPDAVEPGKSVNSGLDESVNIILHPICKKW